MSRIAICVGADLSAFLPAVESVLARRHEVRRFVCISGKDVEEAFAWADATWLEWANPIAEYATRSLTIRSLPRRLTVVRLHAYESYGQNGDVAPAQKLDWSRVDRLVYVAEQVLAELRTKVASLPPATKIPSAIDLSKFPFTNRQRGPNIGMVAAIRGNKGCQLALQVVHQVNQRRRHLLEPYTLTIAGAVEDERLARYLPHMAARLGVDLRLEGFQSDVAEFWRDKNYCLSSSFTEGCPYNVLEAMSCGVQPVVHRYVGADAQFPPRVLWDTVDEAANKLETPYLASANRAFVEEHHNIERQAETILGLFERVVQ